MSSPWILVIVSWFAFLAGVFGVAMIRTPRDPRFDPERRRQMEQPPPSQDAWTLVEDLEQFDIREAKVRLSEILEKK